MCMMSVYHYVPENLGPNPHRLDGDVPLKYETLSTEVEKCLSVFMFYTWWHSG